MGGRCVYAAISIESLGTGAQGGPRQRATPRHRFYQDPGTLSRRPFCPCARGHGTIRQRLRRSVQLVACDVRVATDRRQVGMAEVLGDQPGVTRGLPQPGRGGVAQGVRGHVLGQAGAPGTARDDVGQDRRLKLPARRR